MAAGLNVNDISVIVEEFRNSDNQHFLINFYKWYDQLIFPIENLSKPKDSNEWQSPLNLAPRAAVLALCRLLPMAVEFPSIARDLSAMKIHVLLKTLIQCPSWFDQMTLLGLYTCMKYFPEASRRNFSNIVVPFLERCWKSDDQIVRRRSASCIALFPFMVGPTRRSAVWNRILETSLFSIHQCFIRLGEPLISHDHCPFSISSVIDSTNDSDCVDTLRIFQIDIYRKIDPKFLSDQAKSLIEILRSLFTEFDDFLVAVDVKLFSDLFSCLVNLLEKLKASGEIFCDLFTDWIRFVSEQLIPVIGIVAAPVADVFVDGSIRLLRITKMESSFIPQLFILLASLAKEIGPASLPSFQKITSKILEFTDRFLQLNSAKSKDVEFSLKTSDIDSNSAKRKAQKRKAFLIDEISTDHHLVKNVSKNSFDSTTLESCFRMWKCIVEAGGIFMKANEFRRLQQMICRLIFQIQNQQRSTLFTLHHSSCRYELYNLLIALCSCPHPFCSSTIQCGIRIFETGLRRDKDPAVVDICQKGLSICSLLTKPRLPYMEGIIIENEKEVDNRIEYSADEEEYRLISTNITIFDHAPTANQQLLTEPVQYGSGPSSVIKATESSAIREPTIIDIDSSSSDEERKHEATPEIETVVIRSGDSHGDVSPGISANVGHGMVGMVLESCAEKSNDEVDSMLKDFIEVPADVTHVYID